MKYDIVFYLRGPGGEAVAPDTKGPHEAESCEEVVKLLLTNWPRFGFGLHIVGVVIKDSKFGMNHPCDTLAVTEWGYGSFGTHNSAGRLGPADAL